MPLDNVSSLEELMLLKCVRVGGSFQYTDQEWEVQETLFTDGLFLEEIEFSGLFLIIKG